MIHLKKTHYVKIKGQGKIKFNRIYLPQSHPTIKTTPSPKDYIQEADAQRTKHHTKHLHIHNLHRLHTNLLPPHFPSMSINAYKASATTPATAPTIMAPTLLEPALLAVMSEVVAAGGLGTPVPVPTGAE